jgi:hypothetical protein
MLITNRSPLGDLDIPLIGRIVAFGETVDVTPEQAGALLAQHNIFTPADPDAQAIADQLAAARGDVAPVEEPQPAQPVQAAAETAPLQASPVEELPAPAPAPVAEIPAPAEDPAAAPAAAPAEDPAAAPAAAPAEAPAPTEIEVTA